MRTQGKDHLAAAGVRPRNSRTSLPKVPRAGVNETAEQKIIKALRPNDRLGIGDIEQKIIKALRPNDRLGIGDIVYRGKRAEHVAELVHLLTIDLHRALDIGDQKRVKKIKAELERCYRECAAAVRILAQGERPRPAAGNE